MARFIATAKGDREGSRAASRLGRGRDGVVAVAASWHGGIRVRMFDRDGVDWFEVEAVSWPDPTDAPPRVLASGPVSEVAPC